MTELAGHRVNGPFIVRLEQRILAAPGIASTTASATPCSRAIGACAHHSNSACHRAPIVMMAISDTRRSIDVPNRSVAPSRTAAARRQVP